MIDAYYAHTKRICKGFDTKKLGEYHDLYIEIDTLLLTALKKTKVQLDLLTDINMLLMVE